MKLEKLTKELKTYCNENNLPDNLSADDMIFELDLNSYQIDWLNYFIYRWEICDKLFLLNLDLLSNQQKLIINNVFTQLTRPSQESQSIDYIVCASINYLYLNNTDAYYTDVISYVQYLNNKSK